MHNTNAPPQAELPSTSKLIKSTVLAVIVAAVILVTVVLPAEYAIDITGFGRLVGLQRMGEIKVSLAKEAAADRAAETREQPPASQPATPNAGVPELESASVPVRHEQTFTLARDGSTEIKLQMKEGETASYVWWTDGVPASFDLHADSKALNINYHSYAKGSSARREGILEATFDGSHGWHWRNRSPGPLTITLQTSGEYQDIKRIE